MGKILGTLGSDNITSGTAGDDHINAHVGHDTIAGSAGNDLINAGYRSSSSYWRMNWNDFDTIDYGWRWPSFWGTIYALGGGGDIGDGGGYRVRCEDGTYSNAGGVQGACSWHGGVDD